MTTGEIALTAYGKYLGVEIADPKLVTPAEREAWQAAADAVTANVENECNKQLLDMAWGMIGGRKEK
jgi:hypothetical protein